MAKAKMILVPSEKMDGNKKKDRNENVLVRMSATARKNLGFNDKVELWPNTTDTEKRMKCSVLLDIFQAFAADIKALKADGFTEEELRRVGFVTTKTYNRITGNSTAKVHKSIWISDTVDTTVIGADPEFLLFNQDGGVVRANNVLSYHGSLGCDGAMAEVRPKPAISPEELVANIRSIFADPKLTKPISPFRWMSGCYYKDHQRDYPMGGHIHIGNPARIAKLPLERREDLFKVFNKILDELLAVPMIKVDGAELGSARRTKCTMGKFGYFGEWRTCNGRLEHRTLSGHWLMHPKLATCVLGTAKAIIDEVFSYVAQNDYSTSYMYPTKFRGVHLWRPDFDRWQEFPLAADMGCVETSSKMVDLLNTSSAVNINAKFLQAWHKRMRGLSTYKKYAMYIDGLYEILKFKVKHFQDFEKHIQRNWLEGNRFIGE
jgi:hypothetical protein